MSKKYKILGGVIILIHLIGVVGTIMPTFRPATLALTPLNLLVSTVLLFVCHQGTFLKLFIFFLISFTIGYTIEVVGVKTGFPFGSYTYGETLGWKLLDVPVIIGVNWFLLAYSFGMLAVSLKIPEVLKPVFGALGMVLLDLIIEPVAIKLDYWQWENEIPLTNYIGWLIISFILQIIFKKMQFKHSNSLIKPLLASQVMYFTMIYIMRNFF